MKLVTISKGSGGRKSVLVVVIDSMETFTETGIRLHSGAELTADIIVTATGRVMKLAKGGQMVVDGEIIDLTNPMNYKGVMLSDIYKTFATQPRVDVPVFTRF